MLCSTPFFLNFDRFRRLFWFSDDLALLHELRVFGFTTWLFKPFGENFVPLFKLLWGGSALLFNGAYFPMVIGLWVLHLLIVYLFASLLLRSGVPLLGVLVSMLTLGLSWSNIDLLTFSYHWTAGLCDVFFVCALHQIITSEQIRQRVFASLLLMLGAMCFTREVVACSALAVTLFLGIGSSLPIRTRILHASLIALPAGIIVLTLSMAHPITSGASLIDPNRIKGMLTYSGAYLTLNPFASLFMVRAGELTALSTILLGLTKLCFVIAGLVVAYRRYPRALPLLVVFLFYDLGNAALLGFGRYSEGLPTVLVSRYQRTSLLALVPFLGLVTAQIIGSMGKLKPFGFALLAAWCVWISRPWAPQMYHRAKWQGTLGRKLLIEGKEPKNPFSPERAWQGIPPVITREETELTVKHFNLH